MNVYQYMKNSEHGSMSTKWGDRKRSCSCVPRGLALQSQDYLKPVRPCACALSRGLPQSHICKLLLPPGRRRSSQT